MQAKQKKVPGGSREAQEARPQSSSALDRNVGNWLNGHLSGYIRNMNGRGKGNLYELVLRGVEKPLIEIVLYETRGNQAQAAAMLGINRNTLRRKIKSLGIKVKRASA